MKLSFVLVLAGCGIGEAKNACVCENTWSYPTHFAQGMCAGPVIGCPTEACDGDSDGPWCVVTDPKCDDAQEYDQGGQSYYYAYCSPASPAGPKLAPDDSAIRYIGRFDMRKPNYPRFAWPMTGISAAFQGSQAVYGMFLFPKSGGRLRVVVDGETVGFVQQSGYSWKLKQFLLVDNLISSKTHTIEVYKVSGDGDITFGGFQLESGSFDKAPKAPARRMEFIGDSDTAGWCADGSSKTSSKEDAFMDAYVTWAQQVARKVGAEPMVEAVSGWGVTKKSTPIQTVLNYAVRVKPTAIWDYSLWTPDAVVILIGPNDESLMKLGVNGSNFIMQYKKLLDMVAINYKNATIPPKIINVCGGSMNGLEPCDDIQTANKKFNAEQAQSGSGMKGFYTSITKENWHMINAHGGESAYNGCDSHYNEKGHSILAMDVLPQIEKIMGWDSLLVV